MVTLDGKEYTFNGVGEFTLLKVVGEDTVVQVKTMLAVDEEGGTQVTLHFTFQVTSIPFVA